MATTDDAFAAEAKSLNYTFRAKTGTKIPRWGFFTDEPGFDPKFDIGAQVGGWYYGVYAYGGHGWDFGEPQAKRGPAVNSYSDFAGVLGTGIYVTGVAGTSILQCGVYGQRGDDLSILPEGFGAGVLGTSNDSEGVIGWSVNYDGVLGFSFLGRGVAGASLRDNGVLGVSTNYGPKPPADLPSIAGVFGTSVEQAGVIGTSSRTAGVLGVSDNVGVYGATTNPAGNYAGIFRGNFLVTGMKSAAVPFPDGTQRALYCMESPDLWFEDFGAAKLQRGRAIVQLDANFAKVIKRGDYRVFLTPEGDCRGLYVRRKSANAFEVRELMGGKSRIAFSYRIVGRRKDITGNRRFAKVNTRLPLPAAAARPPRKPTPARLRAFLASLGKELQTPKDRQKGRTRGARPTPLKPK